MVRTLVLFLFAVISLGTLATPGLAPVGALLLFATFAAVGWWIWLAVITRGQPAEVVARTPRHRFLGPGGPDDPFADVPYADDRGPDPGAPD